MSEFTKAFKTADEDPSYAETIAKKLENWLDQLNLDTFNEEYTIRIEVLKNE